MVGKVAFIAFGFATATKVTPVQKVLQMMSEMVAKGHKRMEAEKKIMADYNQWVQDENTRLTQSINTAESDIEKLTAFITKTDNDVDVLGSEIAELDALIQQKEGELADATKIREAENAEYIVQQADLAESVYALQHAIDKMKSEDYDRPQAMMMLQKMAASKPSLRPQAMMMLQKMTALESSRSRGSGAPDVAAYEFQSGGIIELLQGLLEKFEKELGEVQAAETNKVQNYEMHKTHLTNLISNSQKDRDEEAATKADLTSKSGRARGDLAATKKAKAADEKTLSEMNSVHKQKQEVFASNQEVRKAEISALDKAIQIISSPNVADSYADRINLAQKPSFLQTQSASHRVATKQRAADLLQKRARLVSSKMLAAVANEIAANPFAKVVDMIKSLLAKLKEEAAAEADHKAWCDEELKNNKRKRNKKTTQSEKLSAEIEDLTATIASQGKKIATLAKEQEELTKAMGEATVERNEEKAENEATIADAQAGTTAVKSALVVLRDFYDAQSTGFVQQVPEMKTYGGMQSAKGGVVGMLEVIVSDFVRLEAETKSSETEAAQQYDTFMRDAKADKAAKHKLEFKTKLEKDQSEFDMSTAEKMLRGVNEELAKANAYFEQLKPECVEVKVSYEDRVAARKAEIQGLKDAYKILNQKSLE